MSRKDKLEIANLRNNVEWLMGDIAQLNRRLSKALAENDFLTDELTRLREELASKDKELKRTRFRIRN